MVQSRDSSGEEELRQEVDTWVWRWGRFNAATRHPYTGPCGAQWAGVETALTPSQVSVPSPPTDPRTPGFVQPSYLEACCQRCWAQSDHSQVLPRPPTFWAWLQGDLACLQFTSLWIYYYFALSMPADRQSTLRGEKKSSICNLFKLPSSGSSVE